MTAIDPGRPGRLDQAHRLSETGDLDAAAAIFAELAADEQAPDRAEAAAGLSAVVEEMAERLLAESEPERAADVLLEALSVPAVADRARLRVLLGIAHLEMACAQFAGAVEEGRGEGPDAETGALAIELLARTLPLRGRDADAETVWRYGLDHPDRALAEQVRLRLGRDVGPVMESVEA
ncbi:hypothetical protein F5972_15755 [Microbispora cellulosiformans]|uniref:Tetratricopeptide repeat protein n=1 Tax=Microbispora cellulosiformans TaxID=2614688 RepID=A0A5J5K2W3_9ACTN|nr:hypothetical protein [Microbispora cellulosiformans]KAA9378324.1 hypothetical protein F5972_15755 [Microbispora cellulosiformans]